MARSQGSPLPPFPVRRAFRLAWVSGIAGGVGAGLMAAPLLEPITIATAAVTTGVTTAIGTAIGEVVNHFLDDPSSLFDSRTIVLFNIVGMTICTLLFVIPASILDAVLAGGRFTLPGQYGTLAFGLSGFLVAVLRGLIINLTLTRKEEDMTSRFE